jgi:hypothetical protein
MRYLGQILLVAAALIAALPFIAEPVLDVAVDAFADASVGAFLGSFFAVMALFAVPITLLGMASPFVIRLAVTSVDRAGEVAGRIYALSTVGSIVGTFAPVAVVIPAIGTRRTMVATAALLALAAAPAPADQGVFMRTATLPAPPASRSTRPSLFRSAAAAA